MDLVEFVSASQRYKTPLIFSSGGKEREYSSRGAATVHSARGIKGFSPCTTNYCQTCEMEAFCMAEYHWHTSRQMRCNPPPELSKRCSATCAHRDSVQSVDRHQTLLWQLVPFTCGKPEKSRVRGKRGEKVGSI